jgi:uncharacterized membrane protein
MTSIVLVVVAALVIGFLGRNRRCGFWGYFFGSLLLTPFVGLILVLASGKKTEVIAVS